MIHEPTPALIQLHRRLGDGRLMRLLTHYSVGQSAEALHDLTGKVRLDDSGAPGARLAERLADALGEKNARLLTVLDAEYPASLRALDTDAPPFLYVSGNLDRLKARSVAIIGMRRPTADGRAAARLVAAGASEAGWLVVSGNAPGVDSAAHGAAVKTGGETLVFPPTALDQYTQTFHADLPERVTVASPFVPGAPVEPWMFLRRNTLVAAHCHAGFVAETGTRGGTLDTVKKMEKMRRPVFATALPEGAKFANAHRMLSAGRVQLVDVLNDDVVSMRKILNSATISVRNPVASTPVLDDLFPEEFFR